MYLLIHVVLSARIVTGYFMQGAQDDSNCKKHCWSQATAADAKAHPALGRHHRQASGHQRRQGRLPGQDRQVPSVTCLTGVVYRLSYESYCSTMISIYLLVDCDTLV